MKIVSHILVAIFCLYIGFVVGVLLTEETKDKEKEAAIEIAVTEAIERSSRPLNCKYYTAIKALEAMAINGFKISEFTMFVSGVNATGITNKTAIKNEVNDGR